jgi:sugar phosphate permease
MGALRSDYAALGFVRSPIVFATIVVAYGAYCGLSEGTEKAILAERAPKEMRGRAFAALHAVTGISVLPANLLFGTLYRVRPELAFCTSATCALVAALLAMSFASSDRARA